MYRAKKHIPSFTWLFLLAVSLSSCGGGSVAQNDSIDNIIQALEDIEESQLSRLPETKTGDLYVFNNPQEAWEVINVNHDFVTWVSNNGVRSVSTRNPILPILEWQSPDLLKGRRLINDIQGDLFPLREGNKMTFRTTVTIGDEGDDFTSFDWLCAVGEQNTITVSAGEFRAFRVVCVRDKVDRITYYFAPELGYFIRMESGGTGGVPLRRRDLVSYDNSRGTSTGRRQDANRRASLRARAQAGNVVNDSGIAVLPLPAPDNLANRTPPRNDADGRGITEQIAAGNPPQSLSDSLNLSSAERLLSNQNRSSTLVEGLELSGEATPPTALFGSATGSSEARNALSEDIIEDARGRDLVDRLSPSSAGATTLDAQLQNNNRITPQQQVGDESAAIGSIGSINRNRGNKNVDIANLGVHISSYGSVEAARDGWRQLINRFGDILAGKNPVIRPVDLGLRGTVFRLYAIPFSTLQEANQTCESLKARQAFCRVSELTAP